MPDNNKPDPDQMSEQQRLHASDHARPYSSQNYANGHGHFGEPPQKALPGRTISILTEQQVYDMLQPQDWLVHGIIERGFLYAMTGTTGSGKTTIGALLTHTMTNPGMPKTFGPHDVEAGDVIYCAGENPIDTGRKLRGVKLKHGLTASSRFGLVAGAFSIEEHYNAVSAEIAKRGRADLIIVDTAQAFAHHNGVTEENANVEMVKYATMLRSLTKMPGLPAVLVMCHPVKAVQQEAEAMVPKGGGGFLNEIDANIVLLTQERGSVQMLPHPGKFRGAPFETLPIALDPYTNPVFDDTKGRQGWTVVASILAETAAEERQDARADSDKAILSALRFNKDGMRHKHILEAINAGKLDGERIAKQTVSDALRRLTSGRKPLVEQAAQDKSLYTLTKAGLAVAGKL